MLDTGMCGKRYRRTNAGQPNPTVSLAARNRCLLLLVRIVLAWWPWDTRRVLEEDEPLNITILFGDEVGQEWVDGSTWTNRFHAGTARRRSRVTPPHWNSGGCMTKWGVPELQKEVDPRGYIVFSEGRCVCRAIKPVRIDSCEHYNSKTNILS